MEIVQDVVIVGGGIAGLTTSLGLHRLGIRSLVLESADSSRVTGFSFAIWANAWKALDAIGIGDTLRRQHEQLKCLVTKSLGSGLTTAELPLITTVSGGTEVRRVNRKLLLEVLQKELPGDTIRYSSKLVSIEDSGFFKLIHLADGTTLKAKVLIGCDGVNSVVAKFLGFKSPSFVGRSSIRGSAYYHEGHDFGPKFILYFGKGVRCGFNPCDDHNIYWFFTFTPSDQDEDMENNPILMKQFVLSKVEGITDRERRVVEETELKNIIYSPLRFRHPWELLRGNISKGNVCVAGDALHPMTPDIGQGGCAALEDGIVLSRCLGQTFLEKPSDETNERAEEYEHKKIKAALNKFGRERRWRSFDLVSSAYVVGFIQESDNKVMNFIRDKIFPSFLAGIILKKAAFDCGNLTCSG